MTAKQIGSNIQAGFDWMRDLLEPIENRWLIFAICIMILIVMRALGAHGLSTLLALVYVMYFVTLKSDGVHRDL